MSNIDIFLRLPDVADIGRKQLQDYCDQWLKRAISREFGISHLIVGSDLMLTVNLDLRVVEFIDNRAFIPVCELLDYVIDQHFEDPAKRRELHAEACDIRKRWGEVGYQYEAMGGSLRLQSVLSLFGQSQMKIAAVIPVGVAARWARNLTRRAVDYLPLNGRLGGFH